MKTLLVILTSLLLSFSVFADLGVSIYTATTPQSPTKAGCTQVIFDMIGYTGTIGNASFSNVTHILNIQVGRDGDRLNQIPYTVSSGTLVIAEIK